MKFTTMGLLLGAGAMMPAMALAQTAPADSAPASSPSAAAAPSTSVTTLAAGATVSDTSGGTVGSIESVDGDYVILATSKSKVRLPKSSFALAPTGPIIAMTAAQIDAAAAQAAPAQAAASSRPSIVQGAAVADMQGAAVGTVAAVDGQFATLQLTSGSKVRLPVNAFGPDANGGLRVAMSAQQLSAAAGAAKPAGAGGSI